jgi:hypothetical protein
MSTVSLQKYILGECTHQQDFQAATGSKLSKNGTTTRKTDFPSSSLALRTRIKVFPSCVIKGFPHSKSDLNLVKELHQIVNKNAWLDFPICERGKVMMILSGGNLIILREG